MAGIKRDKGESLLTFPTEYCMVDTETTGLNPQRDRIIEIGAIKYKEHVEVARFQTLIKPFENARGRYVSPFITNLTGITNEMLATAPTTKEAMYQFLKFVSGCLIVGYNVNFDINFLHDTCMREFNIAFNNDYVDVLRHARRLTPDLEHHSLQNMVEYYGIKVEGAHRAVWDCLATEECLKCLEEDDKNPETVRKRHEKAESRGRRPHETETAKPVAPKAESTGTAYKPQDEKTHPIVGVLTLVDDEKESYWMLPGYTEGIIEAGGLPIMLPITSDPTMINRLIRMCDGILFTGGHDISPRLYGEKKTRACGPVSQERDKMEKTLFWAAYYSNKPMLGICRGIQFFNAMLGGTLYQDLGEEFGTEIQHHQSPPYHLPSHFVTVLDGPLKTTLSGVLDGDRLAVNSYHHQGIKTLGGKLTPMATADDGLIEAVCDSSRHFLWGVQWHPEFSYKTDEASKIIFKKFVDEAKKGM